MAAPKFKNDSNSNLQNKKHNVVCKSVILGNNQFNAISSAISAMESDGYRYVDCITALYNERILIFRKTS